MKDIKITGRIEYGLPKISERSIFYSGYIGMRIDYLHPVAEILLPLLFAGIFGLLLGGIGGAIGAIVLTSIGLYLYDKEHNHMGP